MGSTLALLVQGKFVGLVAASIIGSIFIVQNSVSFEVFIIILTLCGLVGVAEYGRMADASRQSREREEFQTAALQNEASFRLLFDNNPLPMFLSDLQTRQILAVNDSMVWHYGYNRQQLLNMNVRDLRTRSTYDLPFPQFVEYNGVMNASRSSNHRKADGTEIKVIYYVRKLNYEGRIVGLTAIVDVTESKRAEERVAYLAHHDQLTGLPNRAAFEDQFLAELNLAAKSGRSLAVLCMDLDRFKEVNDVFGHSIGDSVLKHASARLRQVAGEGTLIARLGGDEFTLLATKDVTPQSLRALAARLIEAIVQPFEIEGKIVRIGLTIGIAAFPADGADKEALVRNADAALYRAKVERRGSVRFFDSEMDRELKDRRALQFDLQWALDRQEFSLHYQPQARISGEMIGFEALIRWRHPKRGDVPPGLFVPVAEETDLINPIGIWAIREACREAASWLIPLQISVNLSPIQFLRGDLPELILSVLLETGLSANRLELEITESVLIGDFSRAKTILGHLKAIGVRIALDDFGKGYSSLSYLQAFPFDKIKIDRSFIRNVDSNEQSAAIVRAAIGLGHGLNLCVVAEGVETDGELEFLTRELCDEMQGFLIGKPQSISAYSRLTHGIAGGATNPGILKVRTI